MTSPELLPADGPAAASGVGHLVLVQPSVYGTDNSLMLRALRDRAGRHRGIAVVDDGLPDAALDTELERLHAAGVRGLRFNRVSPVGLPRDPALALQRLAPRLHRLGWHLQWYVRSADLAELLRWQAETGLVFVLDHLAGIEADTPDDAACWQHLAALAAGGAWVKLSGWYRLKAELPYAAIHAVLRRVAALFGERMVWGSDWPHTGLGLAPALPYAATWQPVLDALAPHLPPTLTTALRRNNPQRLYGA